MDTESEQPEGEAPEEGQDADGTEGGNALYEAFLSDVPEEYHEHVIPALKAQDAEITKKFQSNSERTKPFEDLGIFDMEPDDVGAYMNLDGLMRQARDGDEEASEKIYSWWDDVGEALGFYGGEDDDDDDSGEGDEDDDLMDMNRSQLQELLQSQVQEAVGPLAEHLQSKEQAENEQQAMAEANSKIDGWIGDLKEANPNVFNGEDGDAVLEEVLELAELFADEENPIQASFEKYQSLVGKGESSLFASKANQPRAPEGGGPTDQSGPAPTMKNAKDLALAYIQKQKQMS